jgi:LysM repeat protein
MYSVAKKFSLSIVLLLFTNFAFGQQLNKYYLSYIEKYHQLAIKQQKKHGIPASIILAQGLLESSAGQSQLSRLSNNHFGIKCNSDWNGETISWDDDERNECFRKYRNVADSYEDHSLFLKNRPRYASLFQLDKTDYQGWAHGLKKAGYATDPTYAYKLISLIENYNLNRFDKQIFNENFAERMEIQINTSIPQHIQKVSDYVTHKKLKNNGVPYVMAVPCDTYANIAQEFNMSEETLRNYNEVSATTTLQPGEKVYIRPKKNKAAKNYPVHVVQEGESMHDIAQFYGIKTEKLYKMNQLPFTEGAQVGQVLKLR